MILSTRLLAIEADLRRTVAEDEFRGIPELLQRYMDELAREARGVAPGSPAFRELQAGATALLNWVRTMANISRAHCAGELERLPCLTPFGNPRHREPQTTIDA